MLPMNPNRDRVCPVEFAGSLDNRIRRWVQNPQRILAPYVRHGMTALDVGCGPGFFSIEMAKLVGAEGRVIAADLQDGMLAKLRDKIAGTELESRISLVHCEPGNINVVDHVDFVLAFYMVHEVPDQDSFFAQLKPVLKRGGTFLIVEPKFFHVSREEFARTLAIAEQHEFAVSAGPRLLSSWSALLKHR